MKENYITVIQAAKELGVHKGTVHYYVSLGMKHKRVYENSNGRGRRERVYVRISDIRKFIKNRMRQRQEKQQHYEIEYKIEKQEREKQPERITAKPHVVNDCIRIIEHALQRAKREYELAERGSGAYNDAAMIKGRAGECLAWLKGVNKK